MHEAWAGLGWPGQSGQYSVAWAMQARKASLGLCRLESLRLGNASWKGCVWAMQARSPSLGLSSL